jgi:hypothetical protein
MIDKRELRIGNFVYGVSDRIEVVKAIGEKVTTGHWILEDDFETEYKYIDPIVITEDWLKGFGFEVIDDNPKQKVHYQGDVLFYLADFEFTNSQKDGFYCYQINNGDTVYRYVHQLQNLAHSLIGKELEYDKQKIIFS